MNGVGGAAITGAGKPARARLEAGRESNHALLGPVLNAYLLIYLGLAIGHAAVLEAGVRAWMLGTVTLTLLVGVILRVALHVGRLAPGHVEAAIWTLLLAMTANPFVHLAVSRDIHQTTGLLFILALSGYFVIAFRQLVAYQTAVVVAWLAMVPHLDSADRFALHYAFFIAMGIGLAALLRVARFDQLGNAARLSASRAMTASLLETLPVGVIARGANGGIAFANEEAAQLLEVPVDQLREMGAGHPDWRLVDEGGDPLPTERVSVMLDAAAAGQLAQLVVGRQQRDGRVQWFALRTFSTNPTLSEGIRSVVTFVDVTERVNASQAVAESERMLRAIVERVDVAIIATDIDGRVSRFNPAAEHLTGYPMPRAMGWRAETLLDFRPQNADPMIDGYITPRSGDPIPVRLDKQSLGEGQGALWVVRDMRTDLGREHEARLLDKMAALEVLAGGIAHDFNNLMLVVFGNIDAARDAPEAVSRECLDAAMDSLDRARDLTRQLLAFSRESEGVIEPVDVVGALRDVVRLTCGGDVAVAWEVCELPPIAGDRAELLQLFANVLLNARQTMRDEKRLRIEVSAEAHRVRIRIFAEGLWPGAAGNVGVGARQGTGVGLALAKAVAERHHGRCEVVSRPGSPTTFEIELPTAEAVDDRASAPAPARPPNRRGVRALIMDDDELVRDALCGMLEHLGCSVEAVADGEAAIASYRKRVLDGAPPDVAILDLTVKGGLDGASAARRIVEFDPNAPLVVASGYSDGAEISDYREHGFRAALRKPFRIADLDRVLSEVCALEFRERPGAVARRRSPPDLVAGSR